MTEISKASLADEIAALGPWFHNLHLPDGTQTVPDHFLGDFPSFKWRQIQDHLPRDLAGWTALDIGCNAGFYSFELARRGAAVTGIDHDPHYLRQAHWAAEQFGLGSRVRFLEMQVYDLAAHLETYDLVLFMGVLYHLRHPLLALDLIREHVARDLMLFQTMLRGSSAIEEMAENYPFSEHAVFERPGAPRLFFVEHRFAGDPTNWWIPNAACAEAMLRSAGFEILQRPEEEVWLCGRGERPEWSGAVYPAVRGR
jgi:tRNA (mo5U34)-methyltransferase